MKRALHPVSQIKEDYKYCDRSCANELCVSDEMSKFLETHGLFTMNQKEIENPNRPKRRKEIKLVMRNVYPQKEKKASGQTASRAPCPKRLPVSTRPPQALLRNQGKCTLPHSL